MTERSRKICGYVREIKSSNPLLAYITSKGSVGDFIKRYLDETEASEECGRGMI